MTKIKAQFQKDFLLVEACVIVIRADYDCRKTYNSPLPTDEPNPVFAK